ncbi:MAG: dihydroneopterin aldolase [Candidatus Eremiobacteraeota bacterium]|nr:dihydroneopterin aldolase [Candidatus Eremiobacteraeota bacterium]
MSASDRICIEGIRVFGRHGAAAGERDVPQPFDIEVALEVDLEAPAHSDALASSVDYAAVHRIVERVVASASFALLERLAFEIVRELIEFDERIAAATVKVAKPGRLSGATPSVELRRRR